MDSCIFKECSLDAIDADWGLTNWQLNILSSDFINNSALAVDGTTNNGSVYSMSNCYISSNNSSTIVCTSSNTPDDSGAPQQYQGFTSIKAMRSTPNFP